MDIANETTILRGTKQALRGRRPHAEDATRFCDMTDCDTRLSRYNTRNHCYAHRLVRFPRIRGKVVG